MRRPTRTIPAIATVYIHESENRVLNAKDFQTEVICRAADLQSDSDHFSDWLNDVQDLSASEIFHLTEGERAKHRQEYEEYCAKEAKEELLEEWTEHKVEVEVEVEY